MSDLRGLTLHDVSFMATALGETWYAGYSLRDGLFIHNIYANRPQYNNLPFEEWHSLTCDLDIEGDVPFELYSMLEEE